MEILSKKVKPLKKVNPIKKILSYKWVRVTLVIVVILFIASAVITNVIKKNFNKVQEATIQTALSEKRDIQKVLSSSGTIQPLNTYEVTTLVDGEVISADFEEGDQVKEGDVLYQVTTDSLDTRIESAKTAVERAQKNYDKAVDSKVKAASNYEEAVSDIGNLNIESDVSGIVTELMVEVGDTIQKDGQIAKIYDNSYMLLTVPFNSSEVSSSWLGRSATVEIDGSGEALTGTVTKVSSVETVLDGNRVVKPVTIKVKNPGGITTTTTATAMVKDVSSSSEGTFSALEDTVLTASSGGEISKLKIEEGDRIDVGDIVIVLDSDSVEDQLENYESAVDNATTSVENAGDSVTDAEDALEEQIESLTDYSIKAPISGQVISKNTLVGDTIKATNMTTSLCTIYDLSAVTFEMSIDELDIMSVKVGQEVEITADALEGVEITGKVINISLESTTSGGVTQYPVTVKIDKVGDLLPGMNVTGEIILEKVTDIVAVPVDALIRNNVVYVKDDSVLEAVGEVPKGFKEVEVETGISDGDYIQIISGLNEDEEIYVVRATGGTQQMMMPGMVGGFGQDGQGKPQGGDRQQGGSGNFSPPSK